MADAKTPAATPAASSASSDAPTEAVNTAFASDAPTLEFELASAAIYHAEREAFFAGVQRWLTFCTLLASSAAMTAFINQIPGAVVYVSAAAAMFSAFSLVFDLGGKVRAHADLRREYHELAARLAGGAPGLEIRQAIIRLAAKAPPDVGMAAKAAYNKTLTALGLDPKNEHKIKLNWFQYHFRHVLP